MSEEVQMRAIVRGQVQGIYFRDFTRRHARRLGLVGYIRNLWDGTVEVLAEGNRDLLENLLQELHAGPPAARVEGIDLEWGQPSGEFRSFEVRY